VRWAVLALFAFGPITVTVFPEIGMAPATIRISVHIVPTDTDTVVNVEVDGPDYYRASAWPVETSTRQTIWLLRDLPAGRYEVRATIGTAARARAVDRAVIEIH
jgi:hypothetical protein